MNLEKKENYSTLTMKETGPYSLWTGDTNRRVYPDVTGDGSTETSSRKGMQITTINPRLLILSHRTLIGRNTY